MSGHGVGERFIHARRQDPDAGGLVAVVAALLLGIVGMHGPTQHGEATHARQQLAERSIDPHAPHPAPDHTPVAAETAGTSSVFLLGSASGDHGPVDDLAMTCVAMLLTAAVGLVLTLRLMRIAHLVPLTLLPGVRVLAFSATARGRTGPPAEWEFSVVRC